MPATRQGGKCGAEPHYLNVTRSPRACEPLEQRVLLSGTLTVNSSADNTAADGLLTLREAILHADGRLGRALTGQEAAQVNVGTGVGANVGDSIVFTNAVGTISPASPLPAVGVGDSLNGLKSDGSKVVLSGLGAGPRAKGLVLGGGFWTMNQIRSLVVRDFASDGVFAEGPAYCSLTGLEVFSNGGHGIYLGRGQPRDGIRSNPVGNTIGGSGPGGRNYVYSNAGDGIRLFASEGATTERTENRLRNNYVGLKDAAGDADFGNGQNGINFLGGNGDWVGTDFGSDQNVVSGNGMDGVRLSAGRNHRLLNNYIGTSASGARPLGNDGDGVAVVGGASVLVGEAGRGNVIAANRAGVSVAGSGVTAHRVQGNFIGTNAVLAADRNLGNRIDGVSVVGGAKNNVIGGYSGARNVIVHGGVGPGVHLAGGGTSGNRVENNYVGTADGAAAAPNGGGGVWVRDGAGGNTVIGNVISGNGGPGVLLSGDGTDGTVVENNSIGTTADGRAALGNAGDGVLVREGAAATRVTNNVIGGNGGSGIHVRDAGTDGTAVFDNRLGVSRDLTVRLPNAADGLRISGASNTTTARELWGASNYVQHNGGAGVRVEAGVGNNVSGNVIHDNGGLGIDLGPAGVTPNDGPGDPDAGANGLQNFPLLASAVRNADGSVTVSGTMHGVANTWFLVHFYVNTAADPSGHGEGQRFSRAAHVMTDAAGTAPLAVTFTPTRPAAFVTAVANGPEGTSEFSNAVRPTYRPSVTSFTAAPDPARRGDPVTLTAGARDSDGTVAAVSFYREANGSSGLQPDGGDVHVGTDGVGADGWSVSFGTGDLPAGTTYTYYAEARDNDGALSPAASVLHTIAADVPARVVGRHVFYNDSAFDRNKPGVNADDDCAIAPDKRALLPGEAASFANVTGYAKGLHGLMVDVAGLTAGRNVTTADFEFRVGTGGDPAAWAAPNVPPLVAVRRGAGVGRSDRVTVLFPQNAVRNAWLRVTVKATAATGLAEPDVFYFGNLVGETGNSATAPGVNVLDLALVRRNLLRASPVSGRFDFNRDGRVSVADYAIARANYLRRLPLFAAPSVQAVLSSDRPSDTGLAEELLV